MVVTVIGTAIAAGVLLYQNWESVKEVASETWDTIKNAFSGLGSFVGGAFESAMMAAKAPINAMIAMVNSVIEKINEYSNVQVPSWVPGIGGQGLGFQLNPIPQLAGGGIATSSTLANIGEGAEPEAILPLSRLDSMLGNSMVSPPPSVNVNLTVNVQGTGNAASDIRQGASAAAFDLKRELERMLANERRLAY